MKHKHKHEIRTLPAKELRISPVAADGTRTLTGRAIVFDVRSQDLGGFQEVVSPGAVTETLGSSQNVLLLNNHNSSQPLGSTRAGNLQLTTDANGVRFSCKLDTRISYASDLAISVERGDVAGCSFGFRTLTDSYANENGTLIRTLEKIEILELSATSSPAYLQTQVDVRSCPKELRSLMDDPDDDGDDDSEDECECERDADGNKIDPDCTCDDEDEFDDEEDRSSWAEMTLLRLELARRK
jgi:HK97 family phage prohead protease